MAPAGRWVLVATLGGEFANISLRPLLKGGLRLIGSTLRSRPPETKARILRELAEKIWPEIGGGRIRPSLHKTFPITWLGASFMYVYALNQLVIGFLVERHGGRRVIFFGALVFCAGAILFPLSRSLFLLYLCRALVGFGASSFYLSLVHETRRTFRASRFPLALSVMIFAGYAGGIMTGAPFVIGAKALGWRNLLLVLGACALLCWILFVVACRMDRFPDAGRRSGRFRIGPFFDLLRLPGNRNVCLCAGIHFGALLCDPDRHREKIP